MKHYAPLAIVPYWADTNEHLIELARAVPDDKWDWSPEPRLWNFRGIFLHIISARYFVTQGEGFTEFWSAGQTTEGLQTYLQRSWEELSELLTNTAWLNEPNARFAAPPSPSPDDQEFRDPEAHNGHYVAWHRLVHDIHHRADILHYLGVLGVDLSAIPRRRPL